MTGSSSRAKRNNLPVAALNIACCFADRDSRKRLLRYALDELGDCLGVGIDVSKAELVVVGITSNESYIKRVSNEMKAIRALAKGLQESGYQGQIVCESTGHYHLKLAVVCQRYGLPLVVINPLQSSTHHQAANLKCASISSHGIATFPSSVSWMISSSDKAFTSVWTFL